jgi:hypothetical protein
MAGGLTKNSNHSIDRVHVPPAFCSLSDQLGSILTGLNEQKLCEARMGIGLLYVLSRRSAHICPQIVQVWFYVLCAVLH